MARSPLVPSGLYPALITPLRTDESLDLDSLGRLAKHMADQPGVAGIVTSARVGEGPVMTAAEQVEVARAAASAMQGNAEIISAILPATPRAALSQIEQLAEAGSDAVMIIPPILFAWGGKVPEEIKAGFFEDLDAGRPDLPVILFQIPIKPYWYEDETLLRIGELSSVVAMKEASFDMQRFNKTLDRLTAASSPMRILNGNDRFIAEGSIMGAHGALLGIANVLPSAWAGLLDTSDGPKAVLDRQRRLEPLQRLIFGEPIVDAVARIKTVLQHEGLIDGATVRRPQSPMRPADQQELIRQYDEVKAALSSQPEGN